MAFKKKTWVDRMVEYAGRRKITNVTTMAAQIVDVERAEGVVSEEGTAINAVNMNDFEQRTADAFSAVQQDIEGINSDLGGNRFGHTADGRPGWKDGADTVHPFKSGEIAVENKINNSTAISIQLPDGITEGVIVANVISTMNKTLEIQLDCESELLSSCVTMPDENRVMNNSIFTIKAATKQTITATFKNSYGNTYTSGSIFLLI